MQYTDNLIDTIINIFIVSNFILRNIVRQTILFFDFVGFFSLQLTKGRITRWSFVVLFSLELDLTKQFVVAYDGEIKFKHVPF